VAVSITLEITQNSQNIANNTSNVTVSARVHWTYGSWNATGECDGNLFIDGTKYRFTKLTFNENATQSGSQIVMTKTVDVAHNADGSKVLACSTEFYTGLSAGIISTSASKVLTTIARASQPSLVTYPETTDNVGYFGEEFSIHMNRKSSGFTHTVRYEYGNRSGVIERNVGTGCKWTVPLDFINDIPNATAARGTIFVDTYNGSTFVGTKYTGFTVSVPASVKPGVSVTLDDVAGADNTYGSPVQNLSRIKVKITATPAYSSPIVSYSTTIKNVRYTGAEFTTTTLTGSGDYPVQVTVTDKRGRTGTWSYTMKVLAYTPPAVSSIAVRRCNKDGTLNDRGDFVEVTFSAAVSSMSSKNTAVYAVKYKKSSASSWTNLTTDANGLKPADLTGNYNVNNQAYVFAADGSSSYDVEVSVTDRHNTSARSTSASTAFTLINYHPDGNALRFGGVAEKENTFQNDLTFRQVGNSYSFQPDSFGGAKGYILLAVVTLNELNVNAPIVFQINRRGALCPMNVYVRFASSSATTDPDLASITYEGDNYGAFMVKAAASTWKLYVDNTTGWSNPCLQDWYTTDNQMARLSVEFPSEIVEGTTPSVLGTYYRATPVIMPSIIDSILPVGMIIQLYSHANPNTMYPGTTWVRIENAFLWAVDSSGTIGQTGGEKTVTLTVNQIPEHSHGSVYSQHATGTKDKAWYTATGTSVAYGPVSTGGGQAHNNMPPFVQISVWRRTA